MLFRLLFIVLTNLLRSIIGSTPILWFGTRASNALWAEGAGMYSSPQLFCFWT